MSPFDFSLTLRLPYFWCSQSSALCDNGHNGCVLVARRGPGGKIALACFLVDSGCLGVKDGFIRLYKENQFYDIVHRCEKNGDIQEEIEPEDAKNVLLGATKYANSLGFQPYAGFNQHFRMLHDADEKNSVHDYHFGRDGKPEYVQGPNDSHERAAQILATLDRTCGAGNFNFTILDPSLPHPGPHGLD